MLGVVKEGSLVLLRGVVSVTEVVEVVSVFLLDECDLFGRVLCEGVVKLTGG